MGQETELVVVVKDIKWIISSGHTDFIEAWAEFNSLEVIVWVHSLQFYTAAVEMRGQGGKGIVGQYSMTLEKGERRVKIDYGDEKIEDEDQSYIWAVMEALSWRFNK